MPACSLEELKEAFEIFCRVGNECAAIDDYNAFADLFTEDCLYVEHCYGTMHGREAVRNWIVPLMRDYPINEMVSYTNEEVHSVPIAEAVHRLRLVSPHCQMVDTARAVGISFGD